jgi:hypothetical protein
MPNPARSKGKGGSGRQPKASQRGKRLRATAAALDPELFPEEETTSFASRPLPVPSKEAEDCDPESGSVSKKQLLKFVLGILLLPVAFILTGGFLGALKQSDLTKGFDHPPDIHTIHGLIAEIKISGLLSLLSSHLNSLQCLVAGMVVFFILYIVAPRKVLMLAYVFGHEVTHAIWVKLFGGNVANRFHVSLEGGHVLTDRVNTWIVLSPYFFPIYSVLSGTLYGVLLLSGWVIDLIHEGSHLTAGVDSLRWVLFLVLGLTLAFHLVFTLLLITKGQPDLHYGGTFFSLTVIYLINLLLITGLLLATSRSRICEAYWASLVTNSTEFLELCGRAAAWLVVWIQDFRTGLGY